MRRRGRCTSASSRASGGRRRSAASGIVIVCTQRAAAGREHAVDVAKYGSDSASPTASSISIETTCRVRARRARGSRSTRSRSARPRPAAATRATRHVVLLARDRDRRDAAAALARGVHREAAPAAADLEHVVAGAELEPVADAPVLGAAARRRGSGRAARRSRTSTSASRRGTAVEVVAEVVVVVDRCAPRGGRVFGQSQPRPERRQRARRSAAGRGSRAASTFRAEQPEQCRPGRRLVKSPATYASPSPIRPRSASRRKKSSRTISSVWRRSHPSVPELAAGVRPGGERRGGRPRSARGPAGARARRSPRAARRSDGGSSRRAGRRATTLIAPTPIPGANGGLRTTGTPFSQSRSACQWIRPVTRPRAAGAGPACAPAPRR